MTTHETPTLWRPENVLAATAADSVRLSYYYLDGGDVDGYCSLFANEAVLRAPGTEPVAGRRELERIETTRRTTRFVRHAVRDVFGSGRRVAAVGRLRTLLGPEPDVDFVDVFTVADDGLLADRTTFLFTPAQSHDHP
ncbi:MAG TPA: nuclear transport factor 2 family protein [Actinophytocola sp.]|uniref:nuclear transport factor 2 family protein n=1 Tax=Actinophytocola sp. TaxID=1872138 RepID=UPI002DBAAE7D|nr:nuclear transport factor 2 family protein [Actinophytocola sp.]HEU5472907.1 nuclear transport factor 2 family protein [Actinophytocola sp.]